MENLNQETVEKTIMEVLNTVCGSSEGFTMDTPLEEINLKSLQLISISALLEEKLGYAPNFRSLINMKTIGDIRDYILR